MRKIPALKIPEPLFLKCSFTKVSLFQKHLIWSITLPFQSNRIDIESWIFFGSSLSRILCFFQLVFTLLPESQVALSRERKRLTTFNFRGVTGTKTEIFIEIRISDTCDGIIKKSLDLFS